LVWMSCWYCEVATAVHHRVRGRTCDVKAMGAATHNGSGCLAAGNHREMVLSRTRQYRYCRDT
jgi:hypothetical protein